MHALIMEIAGHANAWRQVENAKAQMDRVRFLSMRNVRKQPSVIAEHALIVDRLAHRDGAGAVAAMRSHLRGLFRSVEVLGATEPGYFVQESVGELKKVEWPNQQQVISGTAVVIVACLLVGFYLYANDQLWSFVVKHVLLR